MTFIVGNGIGSRPPKTVHYGHFIKTFIKLKEGPKSFTPSPNA